MIPLNYIPKPKKFAYIHGRVVEQFSSAELLVLNKTKQNLKLGAPLSIEVEWRGKIYYVSSRDIVQQ